MFETRSRYFRVARRDLVYLKFILEAYEGLAVLSTVDQQGAIVRIGYSDCFERDVVDLMGALAGECEISEVPRPEGYQEGLPDIPERKVATDA